MACLCLQVKLKHTHTHTDVPAHIELNFNSQLLLDFSTKNLNNMQRTSIWTREHTEITVPIQKSYSALYSAFCFVTTLPLLCSSPASTQPILFLYCASTLFYPRLCLYSAFSLCLYSIVSSASTLPSNHPPVSPCSASTLLYPLLRLSPLPLLFPPPTLPLLGLYSTFYSTFYSTLYSTIYSTLYSTLYSLLYSAFSLPLFIIYSTLFSRFSLLQLPQNQQEQSLNTK